MAFTPNFIDLVRNYSTTSGMDDFVLGPAVNGFASFSDACAVGDCFYYSALGVDNPADTEVGRGTLIAGGVISRDPIGGKKTNFKIGTKSISLITAAEWFGQAQALLGSMSPVGQALLNAPTAADARAALALGNMAVNPTWYGLVEGDETTHGQANSAAFAAMLADVGTSRRLRIVMPQGIYWFSDTIDIAVGNLLIEGASASGADKIGDALTPVLKFPAGVTGIRVQDNQSSGATTKDALTHAAGGVVLRDLNLVGAFTTTEAEAHGIQLRRTATLENVSIANFEGDGIHIAADGAAGDGANPPYGNADISFISRCTVKGCRNGLFLDGGDANACTIVHLNANVNRQWGVWDSSLLGNAFIGGQFTANGVVAANDGVTIGASVVSSGGNLYGAIAGQEGWCSANAPSGTTADNQGWYYVSAGGPATGEPAWSSGMLVRAGGCVHDDSTAGTGVFTGVYVEQDQGKAQLCEPSVVFGGKLARWIFQNAASATGEVPVYRSGLYGAAAIAGTAEVPGPFQSRSGKVYAQLGYPQGNAFDVAFNMAHDLVPAGYQFRFSAFGGGDLDIRFIYGVADTNVFVITTPSTSLQFGTGAAVAHAFAPLDLRVSGNAKDFSSARRLMIDTAAPGSGAHGQGEIVLRNSATLTDPFASRCVAAGTPGSWQDIYSGLGVNPIGYVTGAGGAVTQATSKSTGVTLNKLCGQITMNGAALAAGAGVAFTVNNAEVAATDTIDLVLASGKATPGTYYYQIDSVSAGSFAIWVKNVSADPLSEALVFNFAVKKGVAA